MDRKNRNKKTRNRTRNKQTRNRTKRTKRTRKTRKCNKCPRCGAGKELQEVNGDHCHCKRCGHVY